jgi:hypothetical protein
MAPDAQSKPANGKKRSHARWLAAGLFAAAVFATIVFIVWGYDNTKPIVTAAGVAIGIGSAVLFLAAELVDADWAHPGELLTQFMRDDGGYPSLARLQFFAWTAVVIFAFTWVTFIRTFSGAPSFPGAIPANILAVMGISTGAALASSQVETLRTSEPSKDQVQDSWFYWSSMMSELTYNSATKKWEMHPSLGRFQMLAWTVISIGIYVGILLASIHLVWVQGGVGNLLLLDLNTTLVVLMGLSQAGFVGSKAISLTSGAPPPAASDGSAAAPAQQPVQTAPPAVAAAQQPVQTAPPAVAAAQQPVQTSPPAAAAQQPVQTSPPAAAAAQQPVPAAPPNADSK